jgi:hypothetical protein
MEKPADEVEVKWLEGPGPDGSQACEERIETATLARARGPRYEGKPLLVCLVRSGTWQCEAVYADKSEDCTSIFEETVNVVLCGEGQA